MARMRTGRMAAGFEIVIKVIIGAGPCKLVAMGMAEAVVRLTPGQVAEWLPAKVVLLCAPNIETLFAILQTDSANFLYPFSLARARAEHVAYRRALQDAGAQVVELRDAL